MARKNQDEHFLYEMVKRCFEYMEIRQIKGMTIADESKSTMHSAFMMAGVSGVIQYWMRSGMQIEPGQVAASISALCEGAASAVMPQIQR